MLGAWGDRHGRKNVLVFAMFLMGLSTFLVGVLPTYAQVGALAPILLVVLRMVQGFAVAGELGGASAMIVEHSPDARRGFFASFSLQGTQAGSILATGALLPLAAFLPDRRVPDLGLAHPVPAQRRRHPGRLHHPSPGAGAAGLRRAGGDRGQARAAVHRPAAHPSVGNRSGAF